MYIKQRLKLIRKYDTDFWGLFYIRRRRTKFFENYRLSLMVKLLEFYNDQYFFNEQSPHDFFGLNFQLSNNLFKLNFFKKYLYISKLFGFKKLKKIYYIFIKYRDQITKLNLRFGEKAIFNSFKKKSIKSPYNRLRIFVKQIVLFYNNFNKHLFYKLINKSLKGLGNSLHFFLSNLESRLDSIILRLNLSTKFFVRNFIKSGFVLVNNFKVDYLNYKVRFNDVVSFTKLGKQMVYYLLKHSIQFKRFFSQPPFYLEINYRTLCILFLPKLLDVTFISYPFHLVDFHL